MKQKTLREDRRGAGKEVIAAQTRLAREFASELFVHLVFCWNIC